MTDHRTVRKQMGTETSGSPSPRHEMPWSLRSLETDGQVGTTFYIRVKLPEQHLITKGFPMVIRGPVEDLSSSGYVFSTPGLSLLLCRQTGWGGV